MKPIVVLGSVNADYVMNVPDLPRPGETVSGSGFAVLGGGKGANQAVAAARLGGQVRFVANVGTDAIGQQLTANLAADGIALDWLIAVPDVPTGSALIFVDQAGENCIGVNPGANGELDAARVAASRPAFDGAGFLLTQLETPLDSVQSALECASSLGMTTVLNPAPAAQLPGSLLAMVDVITPNQSEAQTLTGVRVTDERSAADAARALHETGVNTVIVTLGAAGALISQSSSFERVAAPSVTAVDTTAAGDTFNGALVAELARGSSLPDAVAFGNRAAALSVTRHGAQPSIPRLEELPTLG